MRVARTLVVTLVMSSVVFAGQGTRKRNVQGRKNGPVIVSESLEPTLEPYHRKKFPNAVKVRSSKELMRLCVDCKEPVFSSRVNQKLIDDDEEIFFEVVLDEKGKILSILFVSGNTLLIKPCRKALRDSTFKPYVMNGKPVMCGGFFSFKFKKK